MFFEKLVEKKSDKVEFDILPKTNKEYISVTYGCIRFIDSYRFLSSNLDSLVRTFIDIIHKTLRNIKKELVDNEETLKIVEEIGEERTIEDLKKDSPNGIKKLVEALHNYMGGNDLKTLKMEFPDEWKYRTKKIA